MTNVNSEISGKKIDVNYYEDNENEYLKLIDNVTKIDKKIKELKAELDKKVIKKYEEFTIDEIKDIVINDKWLAVLTDSLEEIFDEISQRLTGRIIGLAERYENPMPAIEKEVEYLESKVEEHLKRMGFVW